MHRGDLVIVRLLGGERIKRRVWEGLDGGALICTEEAYGEAVASKQEPPTVGFRREFIEPVTSEKV